MDVNITRRFDGFGLQLTNGNEVTFAAIMSSYGKRCDDEFSMFVVPISAGLGAIKILKRYNAHVTVQNDAIRTEVLSASASTYTDAPLFKYQLDGATWIAPRLRGLLADEPGLGKTRQALAALPRNTATLVIMPPVVLGYWFDESRKVRKDLTVRDWVKPWSMFPSPGEIVLVPYSRLPFESIELRGTFVCENKECNAQYKGVVTRDEGTEVIGECPRCGGPTEKPKFVYSTWVGEDGPKVPFTLIADEAHFLKTAKARRTLSYRAIAALAARNWLLSGTPLLNAPNELWAILQSCGAAKDVFGSWNEFVALFGGKKKHFGGYDWVGEVSPYATARLSTFMLRRTRKEVLPQLPEKMYRVHICGKLKLDETPIDGELSTLSDDELLEACAPEGILSSHRRQLAEAKVKEMRFLVEQYEENDEPLVVFSAHRAPILALLGRKGWGVITGDTSAPERTGLVAAFQMGKLRGIAGTIGAAGVGITLTRSAHVLFVDRSYVPAENLQAEDRTCRIGQTRGVLITTMVAEHAVDRRVAEVLERKEAMLREAGL
jgi:SNF2-related domain